MVNWVKVTIVLSGWFVSVSAFGQAYKEWQDLLSPGFFFGVLGTLGTSLGALYASSPNEPRNQ